MANTFGARFASGFKQPVLRGRTEYLCFAYKSALGAKDSFLLRPTAEATADMGNYSL